MKRSDALKAFLHNNRLRPADLKFLAGDASNRKYYRVKPKSKQHTLLMDAPPKKGEDIRPFVSIAKHLTKIGLAAPAIYAQDTENGFVLLQDFGDSLFFDRVIADPKIEGPLYQSALDVLDHLHQSTRPPDMPIYGVPQMSDAAGLVSDWYCDAVPRDTIADAMRTALSQLDWSAPVLVLRDYHAQNLIWRDGQSGVDAVGLLDFQDAQIGHKYYDAMSLLDDARRDVSPSIRQELLNRVCNGSDEALLACNVLSAQRSLRILGVFARLCVRDGKQGYIDLIPRVWRNLQSSLQAPGMGALAKACAELSDPTHEHLNGLRSKCAKA